MVWWLLVGACTWSEPAPDGLIPIEVVAGLPAVHATVDGEPHYCLVDTGADGVSMRATDGAKSGFRPDIEVAIHGQATTIEVFTGNNDFFDGINAAARFEQPIDCLLGTSFLEHFVVTVDYASARMQLATHTAPWVPAETQSPTQIELELASPFPLGMAVFDGQTARALVDTGAGSSVVSTALFDRLTTQPAQLAAEVETADGLQAASVSKVSQVGFPALRQDDVAMLTFDSDQLALIRTRTGKNVEAILGASFLVRHAITLDYGRQTLTLRPYSPSTRERMIRAYRTQAFRPGT